MFTQSGDGELGLPGTKDSWVVVVSSSPVYDGHTALLNL